ncbi:MAG TPA: hypothetical protein VLT88_15810, partial [Desulfosarcina sp.]|nr:hypothetical protein [Desulfosarcina sp.]
MPDRRSAMENLPFQSLGALVAGKQMRLPEVRLPEPPPRPLTDDEERQLFRDAMADVVPLAGRRKG